MFDTSMRKPIIDMECFPKDQAPYTTGSSYDQRQGLVSCYLEQAMESRSEARSRLQHQGNAVVMDEGPPTPSYQQRIPEYSSRRYPVMPYSGSWPSNSLSAYPCHGPSPLDTSTNVSSCPLSGNVSSCMYASQRSPPFQPYLGRPGLTPEQWMDLSQDPTMRSRPCFTSHQTRELEREFSICQYITRRRRIELAYTLNLTEKQIKTWFQNRRVKERKLKKPDSDS